MQLTSIQEAIANSHTGPVLAIAVAGSGKTTAIVENIKEKHRLGIDLSRVMVLAFNKDAADRIRNRVKDIIPVAAPIGTCHSVFLRILRSTFQWPSEMVPEWQLRNIVQALFKGQYKDGDEEVFKRLIGLIKANLGTTLRNDARPIVEHFSKNITGYAVDYRPTDVVTVMEEYENWCRNNFKFDFDDILLWAYYKMADNANARAMLQQYYTHLIVDEYQDTNPVQQRLYEIIAGKSQNFLAVGDDDQAIYSFRGSSADYILDFRNTWEKATVLLMEDNFRSGMRIVDVANNLIAHNEDRVAKRMYPHNYMIENDQWHLLPRYEREDEECNVVCQTIQDLVNDDVRYEDIAILTRTNAQQGPLEDVLTDLEIPFKMNGGVSFYDRREIELAVAYAKVSGGLEHNVLLPYLANKPNRFIRKTDYDTFKSRPDILKRGTRQCTQYALDLSRCVEAFEQFPTNLGGFFEWLISPQGLDLLVHFRGAIGDEEGTDSPAQKNLKQLASMTQNVTLTMFLDQLRRHQNVINKSTDKAVTVSTVHRAKGLEWEHVFVMGLNDKIFPSQKGDIEEERRLMYVAMTRAKQNLFLSRHGKEDSLFLNELQTSRR